MQLAGQTALVTGASGALGRATALVLARAGATVALSGLEPDLTEATADAVRAEGGTAFAYPADLSDRAATRALLAAVLAQFGGRLDILVNNAGWSFPEPFAAVSDEHFDFQVALNYGAPFFLSQGAAAAMQAHGSGRIIFISSTGASAAHPATAVYDSMKAGLEALTRYLAVTLGPAGILVNAIQPGYVVNGTSSPGDPTPANLALWNAIPLGRPGQPDDVAQAVLYLCSPQSAYLTGTVLRVDGGRGARAPVTVTVVKPPES